MNSHELAKKLLELPPSNVLIFAEIEPYDSQGYYDWVPVKSFTVGALGVKLSECEHE